MKYEMIFYGVPIIDILYMHASQARYVTREYIISPEASHACR